MHPIRRWRASRSRARSPRMHHASYPVFVHRPAASDWASSRPRLATTPLPFSLPSALRIPGHRTLTCEVTRHARRTRGVQGRAAFGASLSNAMLAPCSELVGCSIFVFELPIAADQHGLKVIVRIRGRITSGAVTDL